VIAMSLPGREWNGKVAERHGLVIVPHGVDASEEPALAAAKSPRRFFTIWRDRIFLTIVVVAAMIGLTRFASHVAQQAQELSSADGSDVGIVIRTEVLHLYLPQTLFERPKHQSLQQFFERPGRENIWYALTLRAHQVNGGFADVPIIRRPRNDSEHRPQLLEILATAGGNPPSDPNFDFSKADVHIFPDDLATREPTEVISELLRHPSPAVDHERLP
jgi:hypothetical protein